MNRGRNEVLERYLFGVRYCVAYMETFSGLYFLSHLVPPSVARLITRVQKCA